MALALCLDNSDDDEGRVRASTYPPRPTGRASDILSGRSHEWGGQSFAVRRNTSPVDLGRGSYRYQHALYEDKVRHKHGRTSPYPSTRRGVRKAGGSASSWSLMNSKKATPSPSSCESESGSSRNSGVTPRVLARRRQSRNAWEVDMAPAPSPTRQQRFVTAMFGLIVVLASMQIIALVAHSPSDKNSPGIVSSNGVATPTDRVDSTDSGVRRIASGRMEDQSLRGSSGVASNGGAAPGGVVGVVPALNGNGHRGGDSSGRAKHNGLSMANPRAFEMVSADMGHLKDKVEKLDVAFRTSMNRQAKDIKSMMEHLGLEIAESLKPVSESSVRKAKDNEAASPAANKPRNNAEAGWQRHEGAREQPIAIGNDAGVPSTRNEDIGSAGAVRAGDIGNTKSGGGNDGHVGTSERDEELPQQDGDEEEDNDLAVGPGVAAAGIVWNAYSRGTWINGQWIPKVLRDDTSPDLSALPEEQRRILLLSERRSGGQAVGGVLNADPRVFYVADPCRMGGGPEALDARACSLAVARLLACQPTINDVRNLYSFSYIVERSRALSAFETLRWHVGGTPDENDELVRTSLERECRASKAVMVKESRLPEVVPRLSGEEFGIEFLHVVRDPRAAIHGMAELWGRSKSAHDQDMANDCKDLAARLCSLTEKKLVGLTALGKSRFRVLKYEMVLEAPFAMIKSVYNWLNFGELPQQVSETVARMSVQETTDLSVVGRTPEESKTTVARFDWATRWAIDMPAFRQQQVQDVCEPLLIALGYDKPDSMDEPSAETTLSTTSFADGSTDVGGHQIEDRSRGGVNPPSVPDLDSDASRLTPFARPTAESGGNQQEGPWFAYGANVDRDHLGGGDGAATVTSTDGGGVVGDMAENGRPIVKAVGLPAIASHMGDAVEALDGQAALVVNSGDVDKNTLMFAAMETPHDMKTAVAASSGNEEHQTVL